MSRQREVIYAERRRVLEGEDMHEWVTSMIGEVAGAYVHGATEGFPEEWELDQLWTALGTLYPIGVTIEGVESEVGGREGLSREYLQEVIAEDALAAYAKREEELGSEVMRELERRVVLSVLDRKWREHLYEMDYLREGIGLRAYSQRDPLVEYQREGYDLFNAMMEGIAEESVGFLFNLDVQVEQAAEAGEPQLTAKGLKRGQEAAGAVLLLAQRSRRGRGTWRDRDRGDAGGRGAAAGERQEQGASEGQAAGSASCSTSTARSSRPPRLSRS